MTGNEIAKPNIDYIVSKQEVIDTKFVEELTIFTNFCSQLDNKFYNIELTEDDIIYISKINGNIIGCIVAYFIGDNTYSIFALTHPYYRNQYIFNDLFKALSSEKINLEYHLENNSSNILLDNLLKNYNFKYCGKEYLLSLPLPYPSNIYEIDTEAKAKIEVFYKHDKKDKNKGEFIFWVGEKYIGGFLTHIDDYTVTIYDFIINEEFRGHGYSKAGLKKALLHLSNRGLQKVILHVSGKNKKAYSLYTGCGFTISEFISVFKTSLA